MAYDDDAQTLAANAQNLAKAKATALQPVANTRWNNGYQSAGAGNAVMTRSVHYCAQGAKSIQLLYASAYMNAAYEVSLTNAITAKQGVLATAVQPWNSTTTYQPGQQVSYYAGPSAKNCPIFQCVTANTNSPPSETNSNWTTVLLAPAVPVTYGGNQVCQQPLVTLADGTTETVGLVASDILPVSVAPGGCVVIYEWMPAGQTYPANSRNGQLLGNGRGSGSGQADLTAGGGSVYPAGPSVNTGFRQPTAIRGIPAVANPKPGVVIVGDSIADAVCGSNGMTSGTVVAGGTGFAVGDIVTPNNAGASAGAVGYGSQAKFLVATVSGGAVSALTCIDTGGYANTATQTGQTLPNGTQTMTALTGSGTGLTATVSFGGNVFDAGDQYNGQGYIQRALNDAGVPFVSCATPGDRINLWVGTRSQSRMALIAHSGAKRAIVALGNNDIFASGDSAATVIANYTTLCSRLRGLGIDKIAGCTVTPGTTSTTAAGQTTLADQIVYTAADTVRLAFNTWLRTTAVQTGIIDVCMDDAALVENGGASAPTGKWNPIAGVAAAADGKHPAPGTHIIMKAAVAAGLPTLLAA